jgi:hypothetical protein
MAFSLYDFLLLLLFSGFAIAFGVENAREREKSY